MAVSIRGALVAAALGSAIAAAGFTLYTASKKRAEQHAVVSVIGETTVQLREALKAPSPEALEKIEGHLRAARGWSNAPVADAAEHYLLGAREIVRRRADSARLAQKAAASRAALSAHMSGASRRDTPWFRAASDLKKQVERDHFDLDVSLKALAELLDSLPDAHKRLAPHVEPALLLEDGVRRQAQQQAVAEARRAAGDLEKVRNLLPR